MAYKDQSMVSPLRRIMTSRGLSVEKVAVLSGVSVRTVRKLRQMDPEVIGTMRMIGILRVAMYLECSPVDLVPFLAATRKRKSV